MTRRSLRTQLVAMGLLAAVGPLLVLLFVVFQVEEDETVDVAGTSTDTIIENGVSPFIPIAALLLSFVAIAMVWFWAKRAVDPIEQMTLLTDEVQAGSLDRRLHVEDAPVELRELSASFDRMLDRLARASMLERRLIEDASHELRTPLAALKARLEVARRRADPEELSQDLVRCETEVERLQGTLDALLASARSRQSDVEQVDNDVSSIVERIVERERIVSPGASIQVTVPPRSLIGIDGASVERAVANLLTNAIQHGQGAPIRVEVRDLADSVEIVVEDEGPGIAEDRLETIFDRYSGEDHGIGLALVRHVADAYGEVSVESPVEGTQGARFTLRLDR